MSSQRSDAEVPLYGLNANTGCSTPHAHGGMSSILRPKAKRLVSGARLCVEPCVTTTELRAGVWTTAFRWRRVLTLRRCLLDVRVEHDEILLTPPGLSSH